MFNVRHALKIPQEQIFQYLIPQPDLKYLMLQTKFFQMFSFRFCEKIRDLVDKDFLSISQKFVVSG